MIEASARDELVAALSGRIALLVIDMQRDYCLPGGVIDALGHDTSHFASVGARLGEFLSRNRGAFDLVAFARTVFPSWPLSRALTAHYARTALRRVRTPELADWFAVQPEVGDFVVDKFRYSAFADTGLDAMLRAARIDTIVACGATTDVCVDTTVRDAFMRDYSVVILSDCSGGSTPARHANALDVLDGFFARVHTSVEVEGALAARSDSRATRKC
ncbi:MAG: cysteine hydrolase [Burkholderiaceae bacterium]|nr:cysteine hydrolase [Burkholderiaceae bacterium]MCD6672011.1 cysteine hydrolase [Burkholderiaceae bacterium]